MMMFTVRSVLILFSIWECVQADTCGYSQYCAYGCCGNDDDICCDYDGSSWGAGSTAGTVVGLTFFFLFVALIVVCCRRRRRLAVRTYVQQQSTGPSVTVVQSSNAQQLNSVAANVAPTYPQYPAPPQYPQPGYPPPNNPQGSVQPPPYATS